MRILLTDHNMLDLCSTNPHPSKNVILQLFRQKQTLFPLHLISSIVYVDGIALLLHAMVADGSPALYADWKTIAHTDK